MPDLRTILPDRPITPAEAADLRHDLVTPLNLIIGYCDLLATEPSVQRSAGLPGTVRAIRQHGFALLRLIDRALLDDSSGRSPADLRRLGPTLGPPADAIIAACDECIGDSRSPDLTPEVRQDLARIKGAGQQMLELARGLAACSQHADEAHRSTINA